MLEEGEKAAQKLVPRLKTRKRGGKEEEPEKEGRK